MPSAESPVARRQTPDRCILRRQVRLRFCRSFACGAIINEGEFGASASFCLSGPLSPTFPSISPEILSEFSSFGLSEQGFSVIGMVHTARMESWSETGLVNAQIDAWQEELAAWESQIARIRARQVELIRHLDRFQVGTAEGARTMGDWVSAHLDVSRQTATRLTQVAHTPDSEIESALAEGRWGLDRAAVLTKLRTAGIDSDLFRVVAEEYSLGRLYGLLDRLRTVSPADEAEVFDSRYLVIQPNLDESVYRLWGQLAGTDGRIVEKALSARETELPVLPEGGSQGQRRADALTTICMDSLTGSSEEGEPHRAVTVAEVFIDGPQAAETYGEPEPGSPPDRGSDPTRCRRSCVRARSGSSSPTAYIPSHIRIWERRSRPRSAASCCIGTKDNARSKDVPAVTASNHTTSNNEPTASTTTPTTSSPFVGITITSPSTTSDSGSTPTVPPTDAGSSPNTTPGHHHQTVGSNRSSLPTPSTHRSQPDADPRGPRLTNELRAPAHPPTFRLTQASHLACGEARD